MSTKYKVKTTRNVKFLMAFGPKCRKFCHATAMTIPPNTKNNNVMKSVKRSDSLMPITKESISFVHFLATNCVYMVSI